MQDGGLTDACIHLGRSTCTPILKKDATSTPETTIKAINKQDLKPGMVVEIHSMSKEGNLSYNGVMSPSLFVRYRGLMFAMRKMWKLIRPSVTAQVRRE